MLASGLNPGHNIIKLMYMKENLTKMIKRHQ